MSLSIKPWIGITALLSLVILAVGWFLVIRPTQASTQETKLEIESELDRTLLLNTALNNLKKQFEDLDTYQAELEELMTQVPSTAQTSTFRRLLVDRAAASGVTITKISTGLSAAPSTPAAAPSEDATDTQESADGAEPSASAEPTEEAPAPQEGVATGQALSNGATLVGIPVEITVVGTYTSVTGFLKALQSPDNRLFLVSGLGAVTQIESPASSGKPATAAGDVELTVNGYLIVVPSTDTATDAPPATDTDEDTAPATHEPGDPVVIDDRPGKLPDTERNPFAPVS